MINTLRQFCGVQFARFHFRKSRDRVVSFTDAITGAREILVVVPFNDPHQDGIDIIMGALSTRLRDDRITVVSGHHATLAMRHLPHSEFIHILPSEVNGLYIPHDSVLERLRKKRFDVAIDLSLDLVLPSGYIVKESRAPVRIAFARSYADKFYNLLIQHRPGEKKLAYTQMARCLEMF